MPDDAWDEYEALELLSEVCADGIYFDFRDGDLMLLGPESDDY